MKNTDNQRGLIKKVNYPASLKAIPVGEARSFKMVGNLYGSMASAVSRLNKRGYDFTYSSDNETNILTITRNK